MSEVSIHQDATEVVDENLIVDSVDEEIVESQDAQDAQDIEEEKPLSQRDEVIQRIHAKRNNVGDDENEAVDELEATGDDDDAAEQSDEQLPETILVKVDGVEREVPRESIIESGIRTFQKESVADMRLREAAERKQELDAREAALMAKLNEIEDGKQTVNIDDKKQRFSDALVNDEDEAAAMFAESADRVAQLESKLSALSEDVAMSREFVINTQQSKQDQLLNVFKREFPQIAGDPHLNSKANSLTVEIMRDNPGMTHEEVVLQAGRDVMTYLASISGVASSDSARAVKRNMPKQVRKASGRLPAKEEPKPKTRSDIIREMQERRGPM